MKFRSIGRKISFVVLIAVLVAVISATGFFLWRQTSEALNARYQRLTATAHVFSAVISPHVRAGDRAKILIALRAIGKMPTIPYAVVQRNDNTVLATLGSAVILGAQQSANSGANKPSDEPAKRSVLSLFKSTTLPVTVPVINGGVQVGKLVLLADVSDLRKSLFEGFLAALVAVVFACLLGMAVASRVKKRITDPIQSLKRAMAQVQETHDFSMRVPRESNDETGLLVESFNDMISQINERDEKLAHHRATLEQTVEKRTKQYQEATVAAEQANLAKSDFLATMSHEIRTPMNGVMVMAELLAGANLLPRQQRYAQVIARSGQSLLTIINDILDLSKIEAGKLELEQVPVSPSSVVDDVISLFWQKAQSSGIDIASFVEPGVPEKISGDPVRLNQILSNLVNNALKFTEKGYVAVTVKRVKNEHGDGEAIEFSVTDTGVGIAQDKVASVFQEFTQADQTTTRKFGGTGLGLSICKKLVNAMKGQISASSVLGKGSRFYFQIPMHVVAPAPVYPDCQSGKLKTAVVVLPGFATRQFLASYLHVANVEVKLVEPKTLMPTDIVDCDAVFACSGLTEKVHFMCVGNRRADVIAVTQLGEAATDQQIRDGIIDDVLVQPVGRQDMFEMIERLTMGEPRRLGVLTNLQQESSSLPQFGNARVLVADDNAVNREVILEVLNQLGVTAKVAHDGQQAVDMWADGEFDLVFMDCSMPVLDGYDATRQIRAKEKATGRDRTAIIALTAHIAGDSAEKWQSAGMDEFITKPFTIQTIADKMALFVQPLDKSAVVEAQTAPPVTDNEAQTAPPATDNAADVPARLVEEGGLPVLDEEVMADLRDSGGGSSDLLMRVFKLFEDNAPAGMQEIEDTAQSDDRKALADAVHALKSMCANIGAARVADACHTLELAARNGEEIDLGTSIAKISSELTEALAEVAKAQVA